MTLKAIFLAFSFSRTSFNNVLLLTFLLQDMSIEKLIFKISNAINTASTNVMLNHIEGNTEMVC